MKKLRGAMHPLVEARVEKYRREEEKAGAKTFKGRKRKRNEAKQQTEDERVADLDKEHRNASLLRAQRLKRLEALNKEQDAPVMRVPDGAAITDGGSYGGIGGVGSSQQGKPLMLSGADGESENQVVAVGKDEEGGVNPLEPRVLGVAIQCYICKKHFKELHHFYDQLCPECASLNFTKRNQTVDLTGRVALVTGARVKIGYHVALKLLRCGASVIAQSRFPNDTAARYGKEPDFGVWGSRLHVYGLDFRDLANLERFCVFVKTEYARLDIIINNAAQTIRRPPAYYKHLIQAEASPLMLDSPETVRLTAGNTKLVTNAGGNGSGQLMVGGGEDMAGSSSRTGVAIPADEAGQGAIVELGSGGGVSSAMLSQVPLAPGDSNHDKQIFVPGAVDVNGQQVDQSKENSWTARLHQVSTPELAEVMAINVMAPTVLNARLKEMMERVPDVDKFIVNVSAMEGKFYRHKNETHPHTNMAKAALNMMTRTSAQDYKKSRIYMTAVDTGWINDEKPLEKAMAHEKKHSFQTPIDEIDAAARLLDPVFAPLIKQAQGEKCEPPYGHFIKDYEKCEW